MDYNTKLSSRASGIKPSGIRKYFDLISGSDVISLGIGEPDFVTPWHIRDAGIASLEKGYTYYTPNAGTMELRCAVTDYMQRSFSLSYDPKDEVVVTVGGSEAIDLAMRALVNPGDEVIVPEPSFVCYGPIASLASGVPVHVATVAEDDFKLTPEKLEAVITPKSKLLVLPYPNNPTGAILERSELEALAKVIVKHDLMVISDEIYSELTYGGKHVSIASVEGMRERTIVVNGFSKSYAMTGWRLGYACCPREIAAVMTRIHQYGIMSAPTMAQFAAVEALNHGDKDIEEMREEYNQRRRFMCDRFNAIGLTCAMPQGAFYMFPCIKSTGLTSDEFCMRLLREKHVAVIPGNAFGDSGEGFVRCCYAASMKNIAKALSRIEEFVQSL
ncbi:MAG: aminotransferase class I/II-fold pyridoxal phosphate-dependent enzyme [Oscillospiraceae bacterium]|nr:aminotransferase class I/II-fold pyridoxal phosphate-dependent enzyme [Oscillospiraceae bacterium]